MSEITLSYSPEEWDAINKKMKLLSFKERANAYIRAMKNITNQVENKLVDNVSGKILAVRTGRLRGSIGGRVVVTNDGVLGFIGSGVRTGQPVSYAAELETRTDIRPRKRHYLSRTRDQMIAKTLEILTQTIDDALKQGK